MQDIGERCRKFNDFPIGFIDSVSDDIVSMCLWTNNMGVEKSMDGDILAFDLYVTD